MSVRGSEMGLRGGWDVLVDDVAFAAAVVCVVDADAFGDGSACAEVLAGSVGSVARVQDAFERARHPLINHVSVDLQTSYKLDVPR